MLSHMFKGSALPRGLRCFSRSRPKKEFTTDHPSHSNRSQRGLFHGKTHGKKYKISFSHRRHLFTQKPNVIKKRLFSKTLNQHIRIELTAHAWRCIVKAGSFDNYLLTTKPNKMNSKYGMYLRGLIKQRIADPSSYIGHIKGQTRANKNRKGKFKALRRTPSVFIPKHIKATQDRSAYFNKGPEEMTRSELAEFDRAVHQFEEGIIEPSEEDLQ